MNLHSRIKSKHTPNFDELARHVRDLIQNPAHSECIVLERKLSTTANFRSYRIVAIQIWHEKDGSVSIESSISISIKYEINRIRSMAISKWKYIFESNNKNGFYLRNKESFADGDGRQPQQCQQREREIEKKIKLKIFCSNSDYWNVCTIIQYFSFQLVWPETRSHLRHLRAYFHNARWSFTLASPSARCVFCYSINNIYTLATHSTA